MTCMKYVKGADQAKEPKPGDLIEIDRVLYKHWAVYIGDGYVVHLSGPDGSGGALTSSGGSVRARITKDKLSTVVNGSDYKVNNLHDHKWKHRPTEEIVKEALSHLNENVDYSVWKCNCEHFATWCRYGEPKSLQGDSFGR
ncbi:phospholipase A and acyltransferase 4-like [Scomber scombrus]|uniref:phospholipase A and acyltransferase 4-like n=1 Tax=Scomber scombrus TaxID=13677 RepID=UPI002DDC4907|nr:phospholipase A and acyltransferase 4-like [Scomber scombrus]